MVRAVTVVFCFLLFWPAANSQPGEVLLNKAYAAVSADDYVLAASYFSDYLKEHPDDLLGYADLSACLYRLGDAEGACKAYTYGSELGVIKRQEALEQLCFKEEKFKVLQKQFGINAELDPALGYRPHYSRADSLRGANGTFRACYDVLHYNLRVQLLPVKRSIIGTNVIRLKVLQPFTKIQIDLSERLTIDSIIHQNKQLAYNREHNAVFVEFPEVIYPQADGQVLNNIEIAVYYHGKPRESGNPPWDDGFVWASNGLADTWASVVCQQYGGSLWWPTKDYLGDKPDSMLLTFEVPSRYELVSNGTLIGTEPIDKNYTAYHWKVHYPINPYNVTFYMGNYIHLGDTLERPDGPLVCSYYVHPKNERRAYEHFSQQVPEMMQVFEMYFGPFPFPRDGYRLVESPYEGMEHQTAIAYGSGFDNQSKSFVYTVQGHDFVILHESAHEWWGNALAVSDLADAWIHEGFATYAEYLFLESKYGPQLAIEEFQPKMHFINNFWPLVQNRNVNEDSFLGSDIYYKGAFLLHSLRSTINDDSLFFNLIRDFNLLYRFKPVGSDEFIALVKRYTGKNYSPFFDKFLYDETLPVLAYRFTHEGEDLILNFRWEEVPDGFFMPFSVGYDNNRSMRIEATTVEQSIVMRNTKSFWFFNEHSTLKGLPHNGLTYFWTSGGFLEDLARESGNSSNDNSSFGE